MSRHRKIQLSRSKAVVMAAAGALSVATAASATAATSTPRHPAGPDGPAQISGAAAAGTAGAPLSVTARLTVPITETAYQSTSASLLEPAYQARLAGARAAIAQRKAAQQKAAQPAEEQAASGSPQQIAEAMLGSFGWSANQFSCLDPLWAHESGWSVTADNAGSGAYGIPQALPGSKMAGAGPDWQTDAATQIRWGLEYIRGTYGSPCGAWAHEQADGWY